METTTQSFGAVADMNCTVSFGDGLTEDQVIYNMDMLADYAAQAEITMRMSRRGHEVSFDFDSVAEYLVIREKISKWEGDGYANHQHTEGFDPPNAAYQNTWVYGVREALEEAGIPHTIEEAANTARITFKSFAGYLMFNTLRDTGFFAKKTDARLKTEGPVPPDARPY